MTKNITDAEAISEKIKIYISERVSSKETHLLKDRPTNGKGGIIHKLINELNKSKHVNSSKLESILKERKPQEMLDLDFQRGKYQNLLELFSEYPQTIVDEYQMIMGKIIEEHDLIKWLNVASNKANGKKYATHVAKLTHSSIASSASSFLEESADCHPKYLTTSSIKNKVIDVTGNPGVSHYTSLLKIEHNGKKLKDYILKSDSSPFQGISEDLKQADEWVSGFKEIFLPKKPCTHSLAKQVYFPSTKPQNEYHLLVPLVSSSLAQEIYQRVKMLKKQEDKSDKYSESIFNKIPGRGVLKITASRDAHRNVSDLHVDRNGELILFITQPPTWKSQLKPPIYRQLLFSNLYNSVIQTELDYLRSHLLLGLSIKNPKRKLHIARWVNNIIDEFLFYTATIQNLPAGWSAAEGIRLKPEHQYLLDPYRDDDAFQSARQSTDWQGVICEDFSRWLNSKLRGKDERFTPQTEHSKLWQELVEQPLREHMELIEADRKHQAAKHKEAV